MSSGPFWSRAETALARELYRDGMEVPAIAARMNRPAGTVGNKVRGVARRKLVRQRPRTTVWHGRCPSFRPLLDIDSNRSTRL